MLPTKVRAKCFFLLKRMKEEGPNLGEPFTKKIAGTSGLFEIRAKGVEGYGRVFYCACRQKRIVVLHSFLKKSQKIPKKELAAALMKYRILTDEET